LSRITSKEAFSHTVVLLRGGILGSVRSLRDLEKRGQYFGNGSAEDKELAHRLYGVVNAGPPLKL
jgi:hypothetical protein